MALLVRTVPPDRGVPRATRPATGPDRLQPTAGCHRAAWSDRLDRPGRGTRPGRSSQVPPVPQARPVSRARPVPARPDRRDGPDGCPRPDRCRGRTGRGSGRLLGLYDRRADLVRRPGFLRYPEPLVSMRRSHSQTRRFPTRSGRLVLGDLRPHVQRSGSTAARPRDAAWCTGVHGVRCRSPSRPDQISREQCQRHPAVRLHDQRRL